MQVCRPAEGNDRGIECVQRLIQGFRERMMRAIDPSISLIDGAVSLKNGCHSQKVRHGSALL
jgi:hypothetical protein